MQSMRPMNASIKAVLSLSVVVIVVSVVAATLMLLDLHRQEMTRARSEVLTLTRILSDQTTRTFDGIVLSMRGAQERLSDNVGSRLELDSFPVQILLRARIVGLPQVKSLFLVDEQGRGVNSSRSDFLSRLSVKDRSFYRYFAEGGENELFISTPEKALVDNQWAYYVSMPLRGAEGRLRGLVVASISIDYFESLYDSIGLDFVSGIRLYNEEGLLLAGKPHGQDSFAGLVANPAALAQLKALSGEGGVLLSEDSTDGGSLVAYRQVAKYPLLVSAAVSETEILKHWRRVALPVVAGVILLLLLVLATSVLMIRNLMRKGALESALKESDERLRHMVQSVRDAFVIVDAERRIVLINGAAERMFAARAEESIGREIGDVLSGCLRESQRFCLLRYLEEGWNSPPGLELLCIVELTRDGRDYAVELSLSTTTFRGAVLVTAVFRDLSERQRAESELLESNRQLQELSASLQSVREEERVRIARELHDELGQYLTGIRLEVSWLGGRLSGGQQMLIDKVNSIKGQIDQTIASVRRISSELRPLVLDDLGLAAAAGWYVNQFSERTGLQVLLDFPEDGPQQGGEVATALFRILQESLTNVARHAQATRVEARLLRGDDGWNFSIRDDGIGFLANAIHPGKLAGIGLVGMRERVHILGGRFSVSTAPGQGVVIDVHIPFEISREGSDGKNQGSAG